jgi:phage virion morphogenesis protein
MAGSFVSVDVVGSNTLATHLNKLLTQVADVSPALREIGEHLLESTQDRMSQEISPDGQPWEPLQPDTLANKSKTSQSNKILRGYGTLADTLNYQLNGDQLMFGSNMEYAATHQFGRDSANIPAREFLGLSDDDETEIIEILQSHLNSA